MAALRPRLRAWHSWTTSRDTLVRMAELANAAADHLASRAEAPRTQRGAAAKAVQAIHRCVHAEAPPETAQEDEKADPDYGTRGRRRPADSDNDDNGGDDDADARATGKRRRRAAKGDSKRAAGINSACSVERFLAFADVTED